MLTVIQGVVVSFVFTIVTHLLWIYVTQAYSFVVMFWLAGVRFGLLGCDLKKTLLCRLEVIWVWSEMLGIVLNDVLIDVRLARDSPGIVWEVCRYALQASVWFWYALMWF